MAASLNKVFLMGNLTRDPELRQAGGQQICAFGIATSRSYQTARGESREDVCYVDIEAWGRTGEIVSQYARKGSPLFIEGRLRYDQWDDRETGRKRSRLTVTAENVQLLGGPRDNGGAPQGGYAEDMPGGQRPYYQQPPQGAQMYYGQGVPPQQPYGQGGYYQQPPQPQQPAPAYPPPPQQAPYGQASQADPQNAAPQGGAPAMPAFQPPADDDADTPF